MTPPDAPAASPAVHVIDDDDAVRDSLAFLLGTDGLEVVAYDSAEAFLAQAPAAAGCIVTDVRMPGLSGLDLVKRLKELGIALPVVVITGHADVPMAVEAMKAGVVDFIEKPFDDELMIRTVRHALRLREHTAERDAEVAEVARRLASLTTREREVFDRLIQGAANKVIAQSLGISPRTVEIYRANVMSKFAAASLSELVRMGLMAAGA